ncbi:MAG TPA: sugar ABC transporter substrate-binding protein [Kribbella sp.]
MNGTRVRAGRRLVAVAAALAVGVLSACGGGNSAGSGSGSTDKADLVFQFWIGGSADQAAWQKVADQAHTDHAGITVKLQGATWENYWAKIGTTLASGKAGCIIGMQSLRMSSYANALLPLDDLMAKYGVKAEDFDKPITEGLKANGKQIAIPYDSGPMVVFYNRNLFKQAGIAEPKPGWTMDEFKAAAKKLTTGGRFGFVTTPGDLASLPWVLTATGAQPVADNKLALTDSKFVEGYQSYIDLVRKDKLAPAVPAGSTDFQTTQFTSGRAAMMLDGPWSVINVKSLSKFGLGIAPMPAGPDGSKTYTAGSGFGIARSCKTPDAAFQAIASMTSEKPLTDLAKAGRAYPSRPTAHDAWFSAANIQGAHETLDYASQHSVPLVTSRNWVQAADLLNRFGVQALNGELPADQMLKTVQDQAGAGS